MSTLVIADVPLELSAQEQDYIRLNPTVRVHNETDWPPLNFAKDGRPQGYSIDYMNLVARKLGLRVQYVTGPSWNEFLQMMKEGALDVMLNIVRTPDREDYLLFTQSYADNPNAIVSRNDNKLTNIAELFGKTVAIPKGFFYEEVLQRDYPEVKILPVRNILQSLKSVSFGKADAALGEVAVVRYLIDENFMTDLEVSAEFALDDPTYSLLNMATRKDTPVLATILRKGIEAVTVEERRALQRKWLGQEPQVSLAEEAVDMIGPVLSVLGTLLCGLIVLLMLGWFARGRPKYLTIRETLLVISSVFAVLILSNAIFVVMLLDGDKRQHELTENRLKSLQLAQELKQSSDDLTRFARTYAVTGDEVFETYFAAVLAIRNGERPHPKDFTPAFWDHVSARNAVIDDLGETYSIESKMEELGFSDIERAKLEEAKAESDALVLLEVRAMNAVKGRFEDGNGEFTRIRLPDYEMARELLYGIEYHRAKSKIMRPIDSFFEIVEARTTQQLADVRTENQIVLWAVVVTTGITIAFAAFVFFLLRRRLVAPLAVLERGATKLANGDFDVTVKIDARDEIGALATSFNIMARSIAERTMRLRGVTETASDAVITMDEECKILTWNPAATRMFGFSEKEVLGENVDLIIPPSYRQSHEIGVGRVKQTGEGRHIGKTLQIEGQRKDGSLFPVELSLATWTEDSGRIFSGILRDVSERVRTEAELAAKERLLRTSLNNMTDGMYVLDENMKYVLFNDRYLEMSGLPDGAVVLNTPVEEVIRIHAANGDYGIGDKEEQVRARSDALSNDETIHSEIMRNDGENILHLRKAPLEGGGAVVVITDVTEERKAAHAITQAMETINQSIDYASHIQRSLLPDDVYIDAVLADHFILWEPRDVVGGDFYWTGTWGDGLLILLGDCTGHGVPGAFMTLITMGALERALKKAEPGDVSALLRRIHQLVQITLRQQSDTGQSDDGLEMGACYIGEDGETMFFAGARFDLFAFEDGKSSVVKGTKASMGYRRIPYSQQYETREIPIKEGNRYYLTSDGLIDQVGGKRRHSFGKRRFITLLEEIGELPFEEQRERIIAALHTYQGEERRRDDVSAIGFKI